MKIIIAVTIAVLFISQNLFSQSIHSFGIKTGVTMSYNSIDKLERKRYGMNASLFYEYEVTKKFNFLTEAGYNQKGDRPAEIVMTNYEGGYSARYEYTSFDIATVSFGFKYYLSKTSTAPFVLAGSRVDVILNKVSYSNLVSADMFSYNRITFGITTGFGAEFNKVFSKTLIMELLYNPDLTDHYRDFYNVKNSSLEMKVGLKF